MKDLETMIKSRALTLIVARSGRVRDGLEALLTTIPQIEIVGQVDDVPWALRMITEHRPALVLLDFNLLDGQVETVLRQIQAARPGTRCTVLVDNAQQEQAAKAAGADGVLIKGFPAAALFATVERLLAPQET